MCTEFQNRLPALFDAFLWFYCQSSTFVFASHHFLCFSVWDGCGVNIPSQRFVSLALATTDGGTPAGSRSEPAADQEQACPGRGVTGRELEPIPAAGRVPAHWGGGVQPFAQGSLVGSLVLNVSWHHPYNQNTFLVLFALLKPRTLCFLVPNSLSNHRSTNILFCTIL